MRWFSNRLSRLANAGKRYLIDPSLVMAALQLDETAVIRDGDLLGRIIGTFTVAQIRLHTGPRPFRLGDRILALPIATLWGP